MVTVTRARVGAVVMAVVVAVVVAGRPVSIFVFGTVTAVVVVVGCVFGPGWFLFPVRHC